MKTATIIGAGINGLMSAYYLSRQGVKVTVLDSGPIPNPLSASCGMHRLIHPWSADQSRTKAARALAALALWKALLAEIKSDSFIQTGIVALDREGAAIPDLPVTSRRITGAALAQALPFGPMTNAASATLFPDFGFLLASRILTDLVLYLERQGVTFRANVPVSRIDAAKGRIDLADGGSVTSDHIIAAAGTGAGDLLQRSGLLGDTVFTPKRCYVVYVTSPTQAHDRRAACWASLGRGDLWGMAAHGAYPLKIGSGVFTRPESPDAPDDADVIGPQILAEYAAMFPQMAKAEILKSACNHWTAITGDKDYVTLDRATVILSDNGGGFKFAPFVAETVARDILAGV